MSNFNPPPSKPTPSRPQAEDMPAFLQRLRRSFRHRSQFTTQAETLVVRLQEERKEQRKKQLREGCFDDVRHSKTSPRHELPHIIDRGSYSPGKYSNSDIYWNSVMFETSPEDKIRIKCDNGNEHAQNRRLQDEIASRNRRHPQAQGTREYSRDLRMTEEEIYRAFGNDRRPRAQRERSQIDGSGDNDQMRDGDSDSVIMRWITPKPVPSLGECEIL